MRGVRVRWASAAKVAAIAVAALVALQALPALLKPPEPPPLAPDVGLPRIVPVERAPKPVPKKQRSQTDGIRPKGTTKSRRRHSKSTPAPELASTYVPPPEPPSAPPVLVPAPSPPPPAGDGSEEFAPR